MESEVQHVIFQKKGKSTYPIVYVPNDLVMSSLHSLRTKSAFFVRGFSSHISTTNQPITERSIDRINPFMKKLLSVSRHFLIKSFFL